MADVGGASSASSSGGGGGSSKSSGSTGSSGSNGNASAGSTTSTTGSGNASSSQKTSTTGDAATGAARSTSSTEHRGTDSATVSEEAASGAKEEDSGVNLGALTGQADATSTVTVGKWGTGQNDCVVNALKGAGYTDQEIQSQGLIGKVAEMNGLENPNLVHPGQELKIPNRDPDAPQTNPNQQQGVQSAVDEVKQAVNPNASIPNFGANPSKAEIEQQLEAAAQKYGVPADIVKAVAWQESTWRANASSFDGGHGKGVMQIDDRYHDFASTPEVWDSAANIDYGVNYLSDLHDQYGSWDRALRAYNGGASYPGKVNGIAARQPWEAYV